jgi:ElaA protein
MKLIIKTFKELSSEEIYKILKVRNDVFVVEQHCPYEDIDNVDQQSTHIFYLDDKNQIIAYLRAIPPEVKFNECSIGRVLTLKRRAGYGTKLMEEAIKYLNEKYPFSNIKIEAQVYCLDFYKKLGFKVISKEFLDVGIPHVLMILEH